MDRENVFRTFAAKILCSGLGLVSGVLVARLLGPAAKGQYALVLLIASMTVSLGSFNIGESAIYFYSRGAAGLGAVIATNLAFIAAASAVYAAALLSLWGLGALPWRELDRPLVIALACLSIPVLFAHVHLYDLVRCTRRFNLYNGLTLAQPLGYCACVLLFVCFLRWGVIGALLANLLSHAALAATGLAVYLRTEKPDGYRFAPSYLNKALAYGVQGHLGNIFQKFNLRLDQLFVSPYWGAAMLGNYSVAVGLCELVWYIPDSIGVVTLPRLAASNREEAAALTARCLRATAVLTLALTLALAAVARVGVVLVFGPPYAPAVPAVYLLLPGVFFMGLSKVISKYFSGMGRPGLNAATSFASALATLALCPILIPRHGIVGAAVASSVAYAIRSVCDLWLFLRDSRLSPADLLRFGPGEWSGLRRPAPTGGTQP